MRAHQPIIEDADLGTRRLEAHAIGQPGKEPQRSAGAIGSTGVQIEGNPELRLRLPERGEAEGPGHHADDGVLLAIQADPLSDDCGIGAKATAPERVRDHGLMRIDTAVVRPVERSTECRPDAEHLEQPRADLQRGDALGPAACGEVGGPRLGRRDRDKRTRRPPQIEIVRRRYRIVPLVAVENHHQAIWIVVGKGLEQDRPDH